MTDVRISRHQAMISDQPISHPVIFSLPKSGTVYVQRSFEATLGAVHVRITGRAGNMRDDILAENLFKFKRAAVRCRRRARAAE